MDQPGMKMGVRHAGRVVQPRGEGDRLGRPIASAIRVPEHPQDQSRRGEAHDTLVVAEPEPPRVLAVWVVPGDPLLQMVQAGAQVVEHGQGCPQHQVPFHPPAFVVVTLGQPEDLLSRSRALLELGPVDVVAGEAA